MKDSSAKQQILQKIRDGLKLSEFKKFEKTEIDHNEIYRTSSKSLIEIFEEEITKISGEFYYCQNRKELSENLSRLHTEKNLSICYSPDNQFLDIITNSKIAFNLEFKDEKKIKSGISGCEYLIARFGSVMVSSALPGARRIFSFPEVHIVIAYENQLVMEIEEALEGIQLKYKDDLPSQITNIIGPSRTADIEKTLILGAHGPKRLVVFVLKCENLK